LTWVIGGALTDQVNNIIKGMTEYKHVLIFLITRLAWGDLGSIEPIAGFT